MSTAEHLVDSEAAEQALDWYAIRVKSKFERLTAESLRAKGYTEFAPFCRTKRRWSDRTKIVDAALFPGYIFCQFDPQNRLPILKTPGVVSVVSFGKQFIPVDQAEIDAIQQAVRSGHEVRPWPYLKAGQRVRVAGGPLAGLEGILSEQKNDYRLIVSVTLLQRSIAVEIDRQDVEPIL